MSGSLADSPVVAVNLPRIAAVAEPRGGAIQAQGCGQPRGRNRVAEPELQGKSYVIPKRLVWDAWLKVKSKGGAAGADGVTVERFEEGLQDNLFRLWNRMVSGSYFPGPVRAVEIPKQGGMRRLGIPNVADRIAQTAAALALEANVEAVFHDDSYGYRPGRSPLDAVAVCRERCFKNNWVVDLDIKSFFDSVPWELMQRALARHTDQKWVLLYVERWLKAPMLMTDGSLVARVKGTPQGSPISPLLANLFLHYGLDMWMTREFPSVPFERFADDAVLHCVSEKPSPARAGSRRASAGRGRAGTQPGQDKDRVLQGQQAPRNLRAGQRSRSAATRSGRGRSTTNAREEAFTGFLPAVSAGKLTEMSRRAAAWRIHRRVEPDPRPTSQPTINPVLRGWLNYYTAFYTTAVIPLHERINRHLMRWARGKYKRLERSDTPRAGMAERGLLQGTRAVRALALLRALTAGRHEPYKPRGLRGDLWGPGGETPSGYPARSRGRPCLLVMPRPYWFAGWQAGGLRAVRGTLRR